MKKGGDNKTGANGKNKKNNIGNIEKRRLGVRKKRCPAKKYVVPERKLTIGNNLVFDKMNYRPEEFLQVISSIKKDIGFKKNGQIKK